MKLVQIKTARFTDVVAKCGAPEVYTLWEKPATDRHFGSLLRNHRVMTIQQSDTGTDFGFVGWTERQRGTYLAFPKSLKRFEEKRIVGVKWDLVK